MDSNKIGKFIYTLRKEKNLSQYQLAEMIPISRQAVSKWERGVTIPDSSTLLRLSEIFDVTINELLNGKRLQDNSIKNLESTTLEIIDQHNIKKKKDRRIITLLGTIIFILSFSFLLYYFMTSYSSIKVYKVGGTNEEIDLYNGLFIVTKEKAYLKLGKIKKNTKQIINIDLCYKKDKTEILVTHDLDIDEIIIINNGYQEGIQVEDINCFLKNSYLKINLENEKTEKLYLIYKRDFINNYFFTTKRKKLNDKSAYSINPENKKIESNIIMDMIKKIKSNGINYNNTYKYEYYSDSNIIEYWYFENLEFIRIKSDNKYIDYYLNNDYIICNYPNSIRENKCILEFEKYYYKLLDIDGT